MNTTGGEWIVIQRNKWGSLVDFNKNWTEYEEGFGDLHILVWTGKYTPFNKEWKMGDES